MFLTIKIAFRNISRQKKRSLLLAGAIGFGMFVIVIINALTGGVVGNIRENFSHALGGQIFITGREFTDSAQMISKIRSDIHLDRFLTENEFQIEELTRRTQVMPSLIFGSKQSVHMVYGVDFHEEERLLDSLVVTHGILADVFKEKNNIILPKPVGERLGVEVGETILIRLETLTGQQNVGEVKIVAFVEDQEQFGLSAGYTNRTYLNSLLGMDAHEYQSLNMFITDLSVVDELARTFREGLRTPEEWEKIDEEEEETTSIAIAGFSFDFFGAQSDTIPWEGTRYQVTNINDVMEPVELIVGVLDQVGLVVFIILLLVTMVGITNTFRMIMIERTREIGTMRAFGMQKKQVQSIFLWEAVLLGLVGCLGGLVVSGIIMFVVGNLTLNVDPVLQFFLKQNQITFRLSFNSIILNTVLVALTSLVAAYWPARAAAKLSPMQALSSHT